MFAIAAINDTDSKAQWEPLAPTKEAQEFHLSQTYHEGLLKLQAKEYEKARELLESVLKDPLISKAEVESSSSDSHLLQLRFLALKNLASVFIQQGPSQYENALRCYLQAVEIDTKDFVIWNQLGTLSCSMGLLSTSRWAFEQGLFCSPNNWNCMEKLLEVLIAIGDEISCLSVAELILRHWPSHARASYVKNTIQESEVIPFAPRGIDKLEPKHVRLRFFDKRKATDENIAKDVTSKKLKHHLELTLEEASWIGLADALSRTLLGQTSEQGSDKSYRSSDISLSFKLPQKFENISATSTCEYNSVRDCISEEASALREVEAYAYEDHPLERRSSRLESRRRSKPDKEEFGFSGEKDVTKVVRKYIEPFILSKAKSEENNPTMSCAATCSDLVSNPECIEIDDVTRFLTELSTNYGSYHVSHLLLEEVASRTVLYKDTFAKFLKLEKLTRQSGRNRTPECSLFLAELYYDFGSCSSNSSTFSEFIAEASYHLCKIIESVALDYPFHMNPISVNVNSSSNYVTSVGTSSFISKRPFWIRFFWLSGRLSILEGNKAKAQQELGISLSLLGDKENVNDSLRSVSLPHCKVIKELTVDLILYEVNLLEAGFLLKNKIGEMIEKEMHLECIGLLSPLLFSLKDAPLDILCVDNYKDEELASVELSILEVLTKACEKVKPMDSEVLLNCSKRKLQILLVEAGMGQYFGSDKMSALGSLSTSEIHLDESAINRWTLSTAKEVKTISQYASQVKKVTESPQNISGLIPLTTIISGIQSLLVALMCGILDIYLPKRSADHTVTCPTEQSQRSCFIDAAITFCKLQHLNPHIHIKSQVQLVVAMHNFLAEYGLCCASGDGDVEEGTFLKFAIKHLLFLDMKLKSVVHSSEKGDEDIVETCVGKSDSVSANATLDLNAATNQACMDEVQNGEKNFRESLKVDNAMKECKLSEYVTELTEDEKEELELEIDSALDQCFFCLYGLNLKSDSSYEDDLALHKNTSQGDYQTKEQCADVFQYILSYAKALTKTGLVKLRKVLRAIRKHFPEPPEDVLAGNAIEKFLDDPNLCEDKLSEEAGSDDFLDFIMNFIFIDGGSLKQLKETSSGRSDPYLEVYCNLYYLLSQSEEISASDKWPGFVLTKEGEEFVEQNAKLFKYDLMFNPLRFESWQRLANLYDEEVDLLLNDGSKQINVTGWRKNAALPDRVDASRRRSRRCLLMTLALAKTPVQQGEIHELLALVYYDGLQNVVPLYDQRSVLPPKDAAWTMLCHNSMRHFKKASAHKEDWSHAFYMGKLSEKLGYPRETSFSYYNKAINLNQSAVDAVYRMHASRLKLLWTCGKHNKEALKIVSDYCYDQSTEETIADMTNEMGLEIPELSGDLLEEIWHMLYRDCLSALETCVDGDLKHFHKARYMLAQGIYRRKDTGDLERAKDELSFCFKSTRSSFTINMWEIDSTAKKGRRKTPGLSGTKKVLEVHLPESSRKFITCIRKYILFYWKLLEETGDICMLDRAYISLRADKRFSLCLEDLVPVALGRYINALISSMNQTKNGEAFAQNSSEYLLEKMFSLYVEQMNVWSDICYLPEIRRPELSENSLYGYLYQYIHLLEKNARVEVLEGMSEKIRKRFKNPKLSSGNCAKVYKKISLAWYRSLVFSLASITPINFALESETQVPNQPDAYADNTQLLCVDLQTNELWSSSLEDPEYLKEFESKWNSVLSHIKNVIVKKAEEKDLETAATLLRSCYNLSRDTSCSVLPVGVNIYVVPIQLVGKLNVGKDGASILDMSTPKKLLLWAHTLLHGCYTNISAVTKHCEENTKSKMKKGPASSSMTPSMVTPAAAAFHSGGVKDGANKQGEVEGAASITGTSTKNEGDPATVSSSLSNEGGTSCSITTLIGDNQKSVLATPPLVHCDKSVVERNEIGGSDL